MTRRSALILTLGLALSVASARLASFMSRASLKTIPACSRSAAAATISAPGSRSQCSR